MGHRMALNVLEELERTVGGRSKYRRREVRPEKRQSLHLGSSCLQVLGASIL